MFDVAVPEEYSNPLLFALPIVVIPEFDPVFAVPRELVAVLCKVNALNPSHLKQLRCQENHKRLLRLQSYLHQILY